MTGTLYVVATPIGNLGDLTGRACKTLESVDFIAAEDTRVTAKILARLDIRKPLVSYYQYNMDGRGRQILERMLGGESCALCCDAGTPAVSDPGELLVRQAAGCGIPVVPVPGPCAAVAALSVSGLPTGRFCFEGFLPVAKKARRERLMQLKDEERTMIFYEAPHKLRRTLSDLAEAFGGQRPVSLARELTKIHEEVQRLTLAQACAEYEGREPKGEYVLVVSGAEPQPDRRRGAGGLLGEIDRKISGGMPLSEACRVTAKEHGVGRSALYREYLKRKGAGE